MDTTAKKLITRKFSPDALLESAFENVSLIEYEKKRWFVVDIERRNETSFLYYGIECPNEFLPD
ncbi:hypothetical protein [Rhizobium rhizogenes]|uniref:hypothetical protein n=1 Tax=Rhizobium rhizogenes TaxID=359 RepID=UPI00226DC9DC|nr:hypothetical protein [Rhizobium rhizogenes]